MNYYCTFYFHATSRFICLRYDKLQPYHQRLRKCRFYMNIGGGVTIGCDRCSNPYPYRYLGNCPTRKIAPPRLDLGFWSRLGLVLG